MRNAPWVHIEPHRKGGFNRDRNGAFIIPHPATGVCLRIIASDSGGWEHVSVSLSNRTPNWREMEFVCRQFWSEEEAVMQLHPPRSDWVSVHPFCLHLWRPADGGIPLPPSIMVGPKSVELDPANPGHRREAALMYERARLPGANKT